MQTQFQYITEQANSNTQNAHFWPAISDFSNTIIKSGEFALKMMTLVNIKAARRKLTPLHKDRNLEPAFSILAYSFRRVVSAF